MMDPPRKGTEERCCIQAVSYFPVKGGDADGTWTLGESPALRGMLHRHPNGDDLHIPKSVLAARLDPGRLTFT